MGSKNDVRKSAGVNWSQVAIEGVVIVVSILLAFSIDAWWDGRREARDEQIALTDLRSELLENRTAIKNQWLPFHIQSFLGSARIMHAIHSIGSDLEGIGPDDVLSVDGSFGAFYRTSVVAPLTSQTLIEGTATVQLIDVRLTLSVPTYGPSISSLDVLFQSGSLANLADNELRSRLTELPAELADISDEELALRDFVFDDVRDALRPNARTMMRAELVAPGRWMVEKSSIPESSPADLVATEELAAALSTRMDLHRNVIMELIDLIDQLDEIIELMGQEG